MRDAAIGRGGKGAIDEILNEFNATATTCNAVVRIGAMWRIFLPSVVTGIALVA
jgi:hypothetical protein